METINSGQNNTLILYLSPTKSFFLFEFLSGVNCTPVIVLPENVSACTDYQKFVINHTFDFGGVWTLNIYEQDTFVNTEIANATLLDSIEVKIIVPEICENSFPSIITNPCPTINPIDFTCEELLLPYTGLSETQKTCIVQSLTCEYLLSVLTQDQYQCLLDAYCTNTFVDISGGTVTTIGSDKIHSFTESGDFQVIVAGLVEFLLIAGGGGSGNDVSGGGAAGELLHFTSIFLDVGVYSLIIGDGGLGSVPNGLNGQDSVLSKNSIEIYRVIGGGGGGGYPGNNGQYPGGGASGYVSVGQVGGGALPGGFKGGDNLTGTAPFSTGGGGAGSTGPGQDSQNNGTFQNFAEGGPGTILGITGTLIEYAKGGRGGADAWIGPLPGTPNTGNGADGQGSLLPLSGGSGFACIRYRYQ